MTNKKRTIYIKKDNRDKINDYFKTIYSENYASLVDLDLSCELSNYFNSIKTRLNNNPELERRAEFTVPLRHLLHVAKEISYTLNSYAENPPLRGEGRYDNSLLIFLDTVSIIQTLQDYIDSKLALAKEAVIKDRGFSSWKELLSYCEATLADLACRGNLKFKKETNLDKWEKEHKKLDD